MTELVQSNRITTLNSPKHLAVLGRTAPKRFTRDNHHDNTIHLNDRIKRAFRIPSSQLIFIKSLHSRKTFGDIDIVVSKAHLPENWKSTFAQNVSQSKFYADIPDTDTTVFEYGSYQVNVHVYTGNIWHAHNFLRNEGGSTLISIMANSLGLDYNLNGLFLKTGIEENPLMAVQSEQSHWIRMLGVSQESWEYHMYNKEDLFTLTASSNFFNRSVFLALEGSEQEAKSEILKEFIQYLKNTPKITGEMKFDLTSDTSRKTMTLNFKNYAPKTLEAYSKLLRRSKTDELFDAKFNIEKVRDITELTGELLLKFMDSFARSYKDVKKFEMYVLTSLPETITKALLAHKAATVTEAEIEAQKLVDATALALAVAQAAIIPEPVPEVPKLVGKAKAKAKAVAKKAKEPELPPVKLAKIAKTPTKPRTKKVTELEITNTPETVVLSTTFALPPSTRTGAAWPFPNS